MTISRPVTPLVVATQPDPHVLCLTLNRPEARNAYNPQMIAGLEQWLDWSEQQTEIRTVVLTGSGKAFCSGADLNEALCDGGRSLLNRHGGYNPLQYQPRRKIWIAALNGHAIGGGFELALSCDFIVAAEQVKVALPEVCHGLLPLGGAIPALANRLPPALARELLLTGEAISAGRALELGLFNRVVAAEEVINAALALAERLNRNSPLAVQACNALLGEATLADFPARSAAELQQLQQSEDYQRALAAFKTGQAAEWQGK